MILLCTGVTVFEVRYKILKKYEKVRKKHEKSTKRVKLVAII